MQTRDLILGETLSEEAICQLLRPYGLQQPLQADRQLQQLVAVSGDPERVANLTPKLLEAVSQAADPDAALRNLEGLVEAAVSPLNLLSFLESSPAAIELLAVLLGGSPFLSQTLIRNPEYCYWLLEGDRLSQTLTEEQHHASASAAIDSAVGAAHQLDSLRRLRRRSLLRIGAQDLLYRHGVEETVQQVSWLAEALLQGTYHILARDSFAELPSFAVLAMGKLGGSELNFSSDVDLIYLFSDDAEPSEMLRFARLYTKSLTEFSKQGHLGRVDLRLRPMGQSGDIAYSESACRNYYMTWADTTDRLALLKCRPVAGDLALGKRFVASIQDFIYKRYLDFAAVEEIRYLKQRTDQVLRQKGQESLNIKLGIGGIREIEFFVQSFQILYGGLNPRIRTPNTVEGLNRLADEGFLEPDDFQALREAYLFFRDVEHKLQLVHNLQTHSLPEDSEEFRRCAYRLGYSAQGEAAARQFRNDLLRHGERVQSIFGSLLADRSESRGVEALILNQDVTTADAIEQLRAQGLDQADQVLEGFQLLLAAIAYPHSPGRIRNLLANLAPHLIEHSRILPQPRQLFSRFDRLCEAVGARTDLYREMVENPESARRLLHVLASGEFLSEPLIRSPELLDRVLYALPYSQPQPLEIFCQQAAETSQQYQLLRQYKNREEFKMGLQKLFEPADRSLHLCLSQLAEQCLQQAYKWALETAPELGEIPFLLLGLGKLGGSELSFGSDLDLVLFFDDSAGVGPEHLQPLVDSLRSGLQSYTAAGRAYQVDLRLRPQGRRSAEATAFSVVEAYFRETADAWERLAYIKARPIIKHRFEKQWRHLLSERPFTAADTRQLRQIRRRKEKKIGREQELDIYDLKVGRGGLLDIQFTVQFLQMNTGIIESNTLQAIDRLAAAGLLDETSQAVLQEGYRFLTELETVQEIVAASSGDRLPRNPQGNDLLAYFLQVESGTELTEQYLRHTGRIRELFENTFADTESSEDPA